MDKLVKVKKTMQCFQTQILQLKRVHVHSNTGFNIRTSVNDFSLYVTPEVSGMKYKPDKYEEFGSKVENNIVFFYLRFIVLVSCIVYLNQNKRGFRTILKTKLSHCGTKHFL